MYKIIYSNQSYIDLNEAISYIATQSRNNALNYLLRYEEKIELLALNPYIGIECKNKLIDRDCRVLVHESHIIVYKVKEDLKEIYLIRIFHGSVDYTNKVSSESNK